MLNRQIDRGKPKVQVEPAVNDLSLRGVWLDGRGPIRLILTSQALTAVTRSMKLKAPLL